MEPSKGIEITVIAGLMLLALTLYAIIKIVKGSSSTGRRDNVFLAVLLLVPIGWIIGFFARLKG